jgi:hypothetical protein
MKTYIIGPREACQTADQISTNEAWAHLILLFVSYEGAISRKPIRSRRIVTMYRPELNIVRRPTQLRTIALKHVNENPIAVDPRDRLKAWELARPACSKK